MNILSFEIEKLNWDKVNGLIPSIVQDDKTLQVLMMGYMNKDALQKTCDTGKVTFYSRTKQRLWMKGETSGNELTLTNIIPDCDNDTLLVLAKPSGQCCHLNNTSCFGSEDVSVVSILAKLEMIIEQRYQNRSLNTYTSKLFEEGTHRIAQKVGEEAVEVALASVIGDKNEIINETADLVFHLLVLLKQTKIDLSEVFLELHRRAV